MRKKLFLFCYFPTLSIKILLCLLMLLLCSCNNSSKDATQYCEPTQFDEIGPFYRPNAPLRNKVGSGYFLEGRVLSSINCTPLPNAKIEFWQVNNKGEYADTHRATVIADSKGNYTFESNRPTDYLGRLPHIHIRVTAAGHEELITQHYPKEGDVRAEFDIVLSPVPN